MNILFLIFILLWVVFNFIDIATTSIGLGMGYTELNPLFFRFGGFLGKTIFMVISSILMIIGRKVPVVRYGLYTLTVLLILVVINNIKLII